MNVNYGGMEPLQTTLEPSPTAPQRQRLKEHPSETTKEYQKTIITKQWTHSKLLWHHHETHQKISKNHHETTKTYHIQESRIPHQKIHGKPTSFLSPPRRELWANWQSVVTSRPSHPASQPFCCLSSKAVLKQFWRAGTRVFRPPRFHCFFSLQKRSVFLVSRLGSPLCRAGRYSRG